MPDQSTQNALLDEAIAAAKSGDRAKAKDKLTRFLRYEQKNEHAWLWMSSVVESDRERIFCLNNVLKLNPNNKTAKRGLALLGALPSEMRADLDIDVIGVDMKALAATAGGAAQQRRRGGFTFRRSRRLETMAIVMLAIIIVGGVVVFGFNLFGARQAVAGVTPTEPPPPTATQVVIETPIAGGNQTPIAVLLGLPNHTATPEPFSIPFFPEEAHSRGLREYKAGNIDTALTAFEDAVIDNKDNYGAHYYIGLIYLQKKDYNKAFNAFGAALRINSAFAPAYVGRGQANFGLGGNPLGDYEKAINAEPDWVEPHIQSAIFYANRRDTDSAIAQLETAHSLDPANVIAHWMLAEQYLAVGQIEDARATLKDGFEIDGTALDLYRVRAKLSLTDEDYEAALADINIYLSYRPADTEGWTLQGKAYMGMEDYSEAVASLNRAIELKPSDPRDALIARGTAQLLLGNADTARADYDKALSLGITTRNRMLIGQAYYRVGDYETAAKEFAKAVESDPSQFDTFYWLGAARVGAEFYAEAVESLDEALSKADTDLRKFDAYYQRGKAHEALDEREKAIDDLREALRLNVPGRADEQEDAALILSRLGGPRVSATQTATASP